MTSSASEMMVSNVIEPIDAGLNADNNKAEESKPSLLSKILWVAKEAFRALGEKLENVGSFISHFFKQIDFGQIVKGIGMALVVFLLFVAQIAIIALTIIGVSRLVG